VITALPAIPGIFHGQMGVWDYTLFKNAYVSSGQTANNPSNDRIFNPAGVKLMGVEMKRFFDATHCDRPNISLCYLNDKMQVNLKRQAGTLKCLLTL